MSNHYGKIFVGFGACISNPPFPPWFVKWLFYPPVKHHDGQADYAPYALRKIEACLLEGGFSDNDVVTVHPERLEKTVGSETKAIGITVMDPLGFGPTSLTFASIFDGKTATQAEFERLMANPALRRKDIRVIVGGPGVWQILQVKDWRERFPIDTIVVGEGERVAAELFHKAVGGESLPEVVFAEDASIDLIKPIRRASVGGLVEVSRGCGRNCQFCTPTLRGKRDIPLEIIAQEVRVNVQGGNRSICLHAEDVLNYGSGPKNRFRPDRDKVLKLFHTALANMHRPQLGISHAALSSIVAAPDLVRDISELLNVGKSKYAPLFGYQTGIETGSVRLLKKLMAGKALPFKPEQWPEIVVQAFGLSKDYGWVPAATLIIGLPGEVEDDLQATLELMDKLRDVPSFIIPQFFMPMMETTLEKAPRFDVSQMGESHWKILLKCIDHSVRWANLLRTLYFKPDAFWLKALYWIGYRLLYFFAWLGGRAVVKRLKLKLPSIS
ncbi:MAG: B12-binding domain-containing radical SAM protein [Candidatus Hecatellaceae archaeon]